MTNAAREYAKMMDTEPDSWQHDGMYCIRHVPSGLVLWVGDRWQLCTPHAGTKVHFIPTMLDRWLLWRAYRRWVERHAEISITSRR